MMCGRPLIVLVALTIAAAACGPTDSRTGVDGTGAEPPAMSVDVEPTESTQPAMPEAIESRLREMYADFGADAYSFFAAVDLNGDGADEVIAHIVGPMLCGTGGCNTLVFTPSGAGYEMVGDITLTRPPIRVSPQSTNGWRDLIVHISGGGIQPGFDGAVSFDGTAYQSNPTSPMVEPVTNLDSAEIVIPEFDRLTDGTPLFTE